MSIRIHAKNERFNAMEPVFVRLRIRWLEDVAENELEPGVFAREETEDKIFCCGNCEINFFFPLGCFFFYESEFFFFIMKKKKKKKKYIFWKI